MNFEQEKLDFLKNPAKKKEYELPDGRKIKIGDLCIRSPEIMFNPQLAGFDVDGIH